MSNWGKGATNNSIGWGQGASNNSISWGLVHSLSWSGDTELVGIEQFLKLYKDRVEADGGIVEALDCVIVDNNIKANIVYTTEYSNRVIADGGIIEALGCLYDYNPPVITITGDNPLSVVVDTTYTELGATAIDDTDGSVDVTTSGTVDITTIASYNITYTAVDSFGNEATTIRVVNVVSAFDPEQDLIDRATTDGATIEPNTCFASIKTLIESL